MEEYQEYSLRGRVFQKIRDGILKGEYKENEELRESTIGKKLGVSRTTYQNNSHTASYQQQANHIDTPSQHLHNPLTFTANSFFS